MSETLLYKPDAETIQTSRMYQFQQKIAAKHGVSLESYSDLHQWSVNHLEDFWAAVWEYCGVVAQQPYEAIMQRGEHFAETRWFTGARLNFAENLLKRRDDKTALIGLTEHAERVEVSYSELYDRVEKLAAAMRASGIQPGDRIAGYMPNIPETVVAMLAATSLGAVWSSCSPDFGISGVLDRFGQIEPRILFAADGYVYGGKRFPCLEKLGQITRELPSVEKIVVVPLLEAAPDLSGMERAVTLDSYLKDGDGGELRFEPLPFDHPLYIMYSSGTTGAPKCIVHGVGGTLMQHIKEHQLHCNISSDDVVFFYTTCGWMMWNWLTSGLASETTLVLYDGSPFADEGRFLLDTIDNEGITVFGTSAKFISALEKTGHKPRESHNLSSLRCMLSTGSPLSHESFDYVYRDIKPDIQLSSISGGTDVIACFVIGNPILPVYRGEIQCLSLGMATEFWNDDGPVPVGEKGELVCTQPIISCPLGFWNDDDNQKFHAAYFSRFPDVEGGVWAHGDFGEMTQHGGVIIHGRSDATLNPGGVRIGTAEIYRQVEKHEEIVESVVIGQEWGSDTRVVLFVVLQEGAQLDDTLMDAIRQNIRANTTPRHVPAKILAVNEIPRTRSGKIVELAIRDVIHGREPKNTEALANPEALDNFRNRRELQD